MIMKVKSRGQGPTGSCRAIEKKYNLYQSERLGFPPSAAKNRPITKILNKQYHRRRSHEIANINLIENT
jgi:hypothetical protein